MFRMNSLRGNKRHYRKEQNTSRRQKVRTIVMGWGFTPQNPKYDEYINLCKEAIENGIFISSNNAPELYGIYTMGVDRNPKGDVNSPQSYKLASLTM